LNAPDPADMAYRLFCTCCITSIMPRSRPLLYAALRAAFQAAALRVKWGTARLNSALGL
jgi:hypothetical protein